MLAKRFDPEVALDRAVDEFWRGGFEGTSAQALVNAMGINRGSLYDTFGSKPELYRRALGRYQARAFTELERALERDDVLPAMRDVLRAQAAQLADDPARRGCFFTNACTEMTSRDPAVGDLVREALDDTHDLLRRAIDRARRRGEIASDQDPSALADFLLAAMHGIRVVGKAGHDRRRLEQTIDIALSALRPAPTDGPNPANAHR